MDEELEHGAADLGDIKADPERRQHVPYILNGELYRIESQNGDNVTVKCCYCPPDRIYRGSVRSTGNFHMHIKVGKTGGRCEIQIKSAGKQQRKERNNTQTFNFRFDSVGMHHCWASCMK